MKFGLSGRAGGLEAHGELSLLELAKTADDLGFDCLWITEEHFSNDGTSQLDCSPSPVVLATAFAVATERIRVGFSPLFLPLHHPVRLAEEIATLDVLSRGRVNFGIARGANARYSTAYGFRGDHAAAFERNLNLMLGYWQGKPVATSHGPAVVQPLPMQQPHPPVYVGAYNERAVAWVAERGHRFMQHGIQSSSVLRRCLSSYQAHGGNRANTVVGRFCYVGESDAQARAEAWPAVVRQAGHLLNLGLPYHQEPIITEADLEPERFARQVAIIGGPDTVVERLRALRRESGVEYVNLLPSFSGFLSQPLLIKSLTLFAREVMPRLADE